MKNNDFVFRQQISGGTARAMSSRGDLSGALVACTLAIGQHDRGRSREAVDLLRTAIGLAHSAYGKDHPIEACCLSLLGTFLLKQSGPDHAAEPLRESLRIREHTLPADDPDIAVSLHELGMCLLQQGAHEESIVLLRRARDIETRAFGADDESTLFTRLSLANSLACGGKLEEANQELAAVSSVLARQYRNTGSPHPLLVRHDAIEQQLRDTSSFGEAL